MSILNLLNNAATLILECHNRETDHYLQIELWQLKSNVEHMMDVYREKDRHE